VKRCYERERFSTISVKCLNPWLRYNYFRFRKRTGVILEFYFRLSYWSICSHRHLILHLPAKFRSNRTIVVKEPDRGRIYNVISTFKDGDHRVGNLFPDSGLVTELISMMYYQSTAEIILLPVSKNAGPPHWNSTSGFDFDLFVIDMSFCIRRLAAELWRHIHFSKWRPTAILDLIWVMLDTHEVQLLVSTGPQIGHDPIYSFGDIAIFIFCRFGLKLSIHS